MLWCWRLLQGKLTHPGRSVAGDICCGKEPKVVNNTYCVRGYLILSLDLAEHHPGYVVTRRGGELLSDRFTLDGMV